MLDDHESVLCSGCQRDLCRIAKLNKELAFLRENVMAKISTWQRHQLSRKRTATVPLHPTGFSKQSCVEVEPNTSYLHWLSAGASQSAGETVAGAPLLSAGASQSAGETVAGAPLLSAGASQSAGETVAGAPLLSAGASQSAGETVAGAPLLSAGASQSAGETVAGAPLLSAGASQSAGETVAGAPLLSVSPSRYGQSVEHVTSESRQLSQETEVSTSTFKSSPSRSLLHHPQPPTRHL